MIVENTDNIKESINKDSKSGFGKLITIFSFVISSILIVLFIIYSTNIISASNRAISSIFPNQNILDVFKSFMGADGADLKGKMEGRTNFLIIGKDYGVNTDTLIVMSYFHNEKSFGSISLPRDLSSFDGYSEKKINAIYGLAESRYNNGISNELPEEFLANFVGKALNTNIHYWARVDIDGLANVIDAIGGITVDVENSFTDCEFPTDNYKNVYYPELGRFSSYLYPCPGFRAGVQNMDSKEALVYARSRKSQDNPSEAIDFARNQRQQKVVEAVIKKVKNELFSGSLILNTGKVDNLSKIFSESINTNIKLDELVSLAKSLPEDVDLNRQNLDYDGGIICPSGSSSDLLLCDKTSLTVNNPGQKQRELQNIFRNINPSKKTDIFNKTVLVTGNGSDVIPKTVDEMRSLGFDKISIDNVNTDINLATPNSYEQVYVYIENQKILSDFKDLNLRVAGVKVNFLDSLPNNIKLKSNKDINIFIY